MGLVFGGRIVVDVFSRKAAFEEVKENEEAIDFHVRRFERGNRDELARLCYQHSMMAKDKKARSANTGN